LGPYDERGARAYNGGLGGGLCPKHGPGVELLVGGKIKAPFPSEAERFLCCHMPKMALSCYVYELFYGH